MPRIFLKVLTSLLLLATPAGLFAAEGVSPKAYQLFDIFGFPVTNSMLTTLVLATLIVVVVRLMVGKPTLVPSKGQALIEGLVEWVQGLIEPIVGKRMVGPTFPLLAGLFVFILINNWSGLFPGVGTFGTYESGQALENEAAIEAYQAEGGHVMYDDAGQAYTSHLKYWFRPANSDLNTTLALAMIAMAAWLYYVLRYAGAGMLLYDIFGNKADKSETPAPLYYGLFLVFFAVGLIEVISILIRPVSLSVRLYGNIFGGENLLYSMHNMALWLVPLPFYVLEVLIGLVQALVFMLLVAVYIGLITNHEEEGHAH